MIRRGSVCWVDFGQAVGSEAAGRRPAVVVSTDEMNRASAKLGRGVLTVVPLTTNVRQVRQYEVMVESRVSGLRHDSKVQTEQVRAVDFRRITTPPMGTLPADVMAQLDRALRLHLAL